MSMTINTELYQEQVTVLDDGGIGVTLDATDSSDENASIALTNTEAVKLADGLYEAAGQRTVNQLVKASELGVNDALIRVAELHGLKVRFRYAKSPIAAIETRTFVPKSLRVMDDHTTFVGLDEDRGGFRSFRTDRIKGTVEVVA